MKSILFEGLETFGRGRGFTYFAENLRVGQKYWHRRVTQLVNYTWGENVCSIMRMKNKCVSKKKRYFYSFSSYYPAISAQLCWILRKNCLHSIGESINHIQVFSRFPSFMVTYVHAANYWLQKEESVLCCRLRSEVGIFPLLLLLLCFYFSCILFFPRFVKY